MPTMTEVPDDDILREERSVLRAVVNAGKAMQKNAPGGTFAALEATVKVYELWVLKHHRQTADVLGVLTPERRAERERLYDVAQASADLVHKVNGATFATLALAIREAERRPR